MDAAFLNINETSAYLNVKRSFLYGLVEAQKIPCYRIGRLIRFRQGDVDRWMESNRKEPLNLDKMARKILKPSKRDVDVDRIIKKAIASESENGYTAHGRSGRIGDLGKEVLDGAL